MQISPNQIEARHFIEEFGPEGTVPLTSVREYHAISKFELNRYLLHTTKSICPPLQHQWVERINNGLLERTLNDNSIYNIKDNLQILRSTINPNSGHRLLQRVLALLTFDGLDPISVSRINLADTYNDLGITDVNIQPDVQRSAAANLYSMKLYQDDERVIRFNIYPPIAEEGVAQDSVVHQHYGAAGSIVLAGSLVNQHFDVASTDDPSEFGIYRVVPDHSPHTTPDEAIRSDFTFYRLANANISRISSHVYNPGDHYNLPLSNSIMGSENYTYPLQDSDKLSFHQVGHKELTATLFTNKYPSQNHSQRELTTARSDENWFRKEYKKYVVSPETVQTLIEDADRKIRLALKDVRVPSTIMERGERDLIYRRASHYRR